MQMRIAAAMILALSGALTLAHAEESGGKQYDTRDPFVCASTKVPAKGAPAAAQVANYVRCNAISGEKIAGGYISLFENAKFEIGKGKPFSSWDNGGDIGIDNAEQVYPIRGTFDLYSCRPPGSMGFPAGRNCNLRKATAFTGDCFKTTFGDWSCQGHTTGDPLAGVQAEIAPPK
jgi:hypothetical protein